jgi:general secretion pathway protein H
MTLVEIMIVMVLIALLSGTILFGSGMFSSSRERGAATLILAGVRLGMTRANSSGHPTRLVFDLDTDRVILEESTATVMLREKEDKVSTGAGADPATAAEKKARTEAERILEGPKAPRPRFKLLKQGGFSNSDEKGRELGKGVEFRQVQTDHDGEPRTEGRAYLYFWPGGTTERASIQLRRTDGHDEGLTVTVSPLTGRAKIERGKVNLPERPLDKDYSERDETL